jgi:hypothetical protein
VCHDVRRTWARSGDESETALNRKRGAACRALRWATTGLSGAVVRVVGAGAVVFVVDVGAAGTVSAAGSVVDVRAGVDAPPPPQPAASIAPPTTAATACLRIDPVSRHLSHLPHPIIRPRSQEAPQVASFAAETRTFLAIHQELADRAE